MKLVSLLLSLCICLSLSCSYSAEEEVEKLRQKLDSISVLTDKTVELMNTIQTCVEYIDAIEINKEDEFREYINEGFDSIKQNHQINTIVFYSDTTAEILYNIEELDNLLFSIKEMCTYDNIDFTIPE